MTGTQFHRYVLTLLVVALTAALAPAAAWAGSGTSKGVHIDSGSPAGKQYSIPLGNARGNGTSGTNKLFGSGITKHKTTTTTASTPTTVSTPAAKPAHTRQRGHHKKKTAKQKSKAAAAATHTTPSGPKPTAHKVSPGTAIGTEAGSSSSGITWMIVVALVVLVLGGFGGAVLARRSRSSDPTTS